MDKCCISVKEEKCDEPDTTCGLIDFKQEEELIIPDLGGLIDFKQEEELIIPDLVIGKKFKKGRTQKSKRNQRRNLGTMEENRMDISVKKEKCDKPKNTCDLIDFKLEEELVIGAFNDLKPEFEELIIPDLGAFNDLKPEFEELIIPDLGGFFDPGPAELFFSELDHAVHLLLQ